VSRDKVKVIIFDDFKESALTAYKESLDFLEGRYDGRIEFPVLNSSHKHRFKWLSNLVLSPPEFFSPAVLFIRQWLISHRFPLVESIKKRLNVKSQRNYISSDLELRLKEYFRKDVEDLSNIIGRDLTGWTK
jgi:hypothetical protein